MSEIQARFQTIGTDPLASTQTIRMSLKDVQLSKERLAFLAKMPFFLNSSLQLQRVVLIALEHIREELCADTVVVFVHQAGEEELTYWALRSHAAERLEGRAALAENIAVQAAIEHRFPVILDKDSTWGATGGLLDSFGIKVENLLCMPLLVRGSHCVGAIQIINKAEGNGFNSEDTAFVEQFNHQLALAIENARLLEEAQTQSAKLLELDRRKSEVISIIAHEFRTPLNIIKTTAELLGNEQIVQQPEEMLKLLHGGVDRLTRLIGQIRNVSLVQDQNLDLSMAPVDLNQLCQDAVTKFAQIVAQRDITFRYKSAELPAWVQAEGSLIAIVLQNLISNAIRFTPDGGTVLVRVTSNGTDVRVAVVDNGIGIAEQELPLIFEKFYEVNELLNHSSGEFQFRSGGLGLGLAAVRHIVEAHKSTVEVQSAIGKGSSFSFTLPAVKPPGE